MSSTCKSCNRVFQITQADLELLKLVSSVELIPPPRFCPDCRQQRRLAFRNERTLYSRTCDLTGKKIVSIYSQQSPYIVYDRDAWWGDSWDAKTYGRDFDFSIPFFEQFDELYRDVPKAALASSSSENSVFTNYSWYCKDCYLILGWGEHSEHCLYGKLVINCRDCVDVTHAIDCELCYDSLDIERCYALNFSQGCKGCSASSYLKNCVGCADCFGCINLVNQKFCIFNKQYSQTEYQTKVAELKASDRAELLQKVVTFFETQPQKYYQGINTENCTGDYLNNSKNLRECFDTSASEDCAYLTDCIECKQCMDLSVAGKFNTELAYECVSYTGYGCAFVHLAWGCNNLLYSQECFNGSQFCFGSTGLKHQEYLILNKPHTKEEYFRKLPKIINHMRETGEWGEFFPAYLSPFGYNETVAAEYFPLTQTAAVGKGFNWRAEAEMPNTAAGIGEGILTCAKSGRKFRLVKSELEFYQQQGLPHPTLHPDERHYARLARRNRRKLFIRKCDACSVALESTYAPDAKERVLCEKCFQVEVY